MRFHQAPRPLLQLLTTVLLTPHSTLAFPRHAGVSFNDLFARGCDNPCGYDDQYCCGANEGCYTDTNNIAQCTAQGGGGGGSGGYWQLYTTTYTETDLVTRTSVYSSYMAGGGGVSPATATAACNWALNETPCGSICCASDQYCYQQGQCANAAGGGSSGYYSSYATNSAGAPIRPTTSGTVVITATVSPTTTVPFMAPVATGANVTLTEDHSGGGGLSGGAIAGIVIGVLAGLALLALLCFYCCLRGLLDGCLACFGLGNRRRRRTEVDEYERRSHHSSHGGRAGRTWYGAARPTTRVDRVERKSHEGRNLLGIGAGLAALWAILGLKRRRDNRRNEEKYSEYSYSSDYYTNTSSSE